MAAESGTPLVGLVVHHERAEAARLARQTVEWLAAVHRLVRVPADDARATGIDERYGVDPSRFVGEEGQGSELDVVVSLGGDGTMLRTVRLLGGSLVPIIGVNLGHLGYLAEIEPQQLHTVVDAVLSGDYGYEDRMLLDVKATGSPPAGGTKGGQIRRALALNEAVLERKSSGHTVRLEVDLAGQSFTTYEADALIVSTPTGSTAYAFSARGPIIEPAHCAVLITPVSPHMLFDRSLVLDPATGIRVTVTGHRPAILTVDGQGVAELDPGSVVELSASENVARLVRYSPSHFHSILKAKFGLNDR